MSRLSGCGSGEIRKPQVGGSIPLASSNLSSTYIIGNLARIVWCYQSVKKVGVQPTSGLLSAGF